LEQSRARWAYSGQGLELRILTQISTLFLDLKHIALSVLSGSLSPMEVLIGMPGGFVEWGLSASSSWKFYTTHLAPPNLCLKVDHWFSESRVWTAGYLWRSIRPSNPLRSVWNCKVTRCWSLPKFPAWLGDKEKCITTQSQVLWSLRDQDFNRTK
jgi:hypothetical protein